MEKKTGAPGKPSFEPSLVPFVRCILQHIDPLRLNARAVFFSCPLYMSARMCTCLQTKVNSGCLPSQCTLYLRFQGRISHGNWCLLILLVGQQVPRILLSPPSCNWDYRHSLLDRDFYMDAKNTNSNLHGFAAYQLSHLPASWKSFVLERGLGS